MLAVYNSASICAFDEPLKCGLRLDPGSCMTVLKSRLQTYRLRNENLFYSRFRLKHNHVSEQRLERTPTHVDRVEKEDGTKNQGPVRTARGRHQPSGFVEQYVRGLKIIYTRILSHMRTQSHGFKLFAFGRTRRVILSSSPQT